MKELKELLVEFGDGESGRRVLGPSQVVHRVVEPAKALESSVARLLNSRLLSKVFIGNFAIKRMLRAAPALRELAMLDAVGQIADEAQGARVVVDMPATGHGLAWMRLPIQMRDLFGSGGLYELSERLVHRLVKPSQCSVVVVTLPERMVLQETLELCKGLEDEVGMPASRLVVNRFPRGLSPDALQQAKSFAAQTSEYAKEAQRLIDALEARDAIRREALETLGEAAQWGIGVRPLLIPLVDGDPSASVVAQWLTREKAA